MHTDTRTLQTWPGGQSFTITGDVNGPADQRRLKAGHAREARWRKGTAAEWATIRASILAEVYAERDIFACDSALVDDLIKAANAGHIGDRDLRSAFEYEGIRNLYADPSDWDAAQCREYAEDNGIDLPDVPMTDCNVCDGTGRYGDVETGNPDTNRKCENCSGTGEEPEPDYREDDGPRGWLTEARDACREYAQDNPAEVFEWWRVSRWLCEQLHAIGEVTIDNDYGYWWGRTCTGQGLIMDGTLQRIAAQFVREEA